MEERIQAEEVIEPCWLCGASRRLMKFVRYPKVRTDHRPEEEHRAADPNRIPAWREGEQSDNLETRG